jgi:hypothetical protein
MPIASVRCPVLGALITRVIDADGHTVSVDCEEYSPRDGLCGLKQHARELGMLTRLLSHVSGDALDTKNVACFFCSAGLPRPS